MLRRYGKHTAHTFVFLLFFFSSAAFAQEKLRLVSPQQSTIAYGGAPSRAIDGNSSGVWPNRSVTRTINEHQPWWTANLEQSSDISEIVIWNRTDCCTDRLSRFYVFVSESPFDPNAKTYNLQDDNANVEEFYVWQLSGSSVTIPINKKAKHIRIQLGTRNILSLAEVEVFGKQSNDDGPSGDDPEIALSNASQSSTADNGVASRAIDGNTSGEGPDGSITLTRNEFEPWWSAKLASRSSISSCLYRTSRLVSTQPLLNWRMIPMWGIFIFPVIYLAPVSRYR